MPVRGSPGQARQHRDELPGRGLLDREVGVAPPLPALVQALDDLAGAAEQDDRRGEHLIRVGPEPARQLRGGRLRVAGDLGEPQPRMNLQLAEARAGLAGKRGAAPREPEIRD